MTIQAVVQLRFEYRLPKRGAPRVAAFRCLRHYAVKPKPDAIPTFRLRLESAWRLA